MRRIPVMTDEITISEEKLKQILTDMIMLEKNNNKKEEFNDVQMVDKLLAILEEKV